MMVMRQGMAIPLISLQEDHDNRQLSNIIVVTNSPLGKMGLMMDEIIGQQQVVMKPLSGHLKNIRGGVGCALLSSGDVAIALDVESLFSNEEMTRSN